MKRTVFAVFIMIIGMAMCIFAITLSAVSGFYKGSEDKRDLSLEAPKNKPEAMLLTGDYYMDGEADSQKITISDKTITLGDGSCVDYMFTVWRNLTETDETTGEIVYYDYCFLKTPDENIRYFPDKKEVEIDGRVYKRLSV